MDAHLPPLLGRCLVRPAGGLLLSVLAACAGRSAPGAPGPAADRCDLAVPGQGPRAAAISPVAAAGRAGGTAEGPHRRDVGQPGLVVALSGAVEPGDAPVARNEAERLVFGQLYETLVRVDCRGEARPLLAASWDTAGAGRRWTFHLRPAARDWDGALVGAAEVVRSWLLGPGAADVGALTVVDDSTLLVELPHQVGAAFFARPELAVALPGSPGAWPAGTGPYRPDSTLAVPGRLVLVPAAGGGPVEIRTMTGDPRNALDSGVDLLVTRDPAALDYAAASGSYGQVPLSWDRVYLLAVPAGPGERGVGAPPPAELRALARDAVRVEARAAEATSAGLATCAAGATPNAIGDPAAPPGDRLVGGDALAEASRSPRVIYPERDAAAAGLAQRVVALARAGGSSAWLVPLPTAGGAGISAHGLSDPVFAQALRTGDAAVFIFPVARTVDGGACELLARARRRASWLRPSELVPLVETRPTAVVRAGVSGIRVDGTGTLLLGAARAAGRRR